MDPFKVLMISPTSTLNDIKKAYRELALQYHPDKRGPSCTAKFQQLQAAYELAIETIGEKETVQTQEKTTAQSPFAASYSNPNYTPHNSWNLPPRVPRYSAYSLISDFSQIMFRLRQWFVNKGSAVPGHMQDSIAKLPITQKIQSTLDLFDVLRNGPAAPATLAAHIGNELVLLKHFWAITIKAGSGQEGNAVNASFWSMLINTSITGLLAPHDLLEAGRAFLSLEMEVSVVWTTASDV